MPKILPWSFSALEDFVNCPRAFHAKRVEKSVRDVQGEEAKWGEWVHKQFELRQQGGVLPEELSLHEPFMEKLQAKQGVLYTEQKIALNKQLKPCGFFDKDVWFRGIIDYKKLDGATATLVDYKTGKVKPKERQLALFAIHTFTMHPEIKLLNCQYYWTQIQDVTKKVYGRADIPCLWAEIIPDLRQYKQAFVEDIWQPRQSGLCRRHCPVVLCEYNGRN